MIELTPDECRVLGVLIDEMLFKTPEDSPNPEEIKTSLANMIKSVE